MIIPIDLTGDPRRREVYDVFVRSRGVGRPWYQQSAYEEWLIEIEDAEPEERHEIYAALSEDGTLVGCAMLWFPDADNTDKLYSDIDVDPVARGQGYGGLLVDHVLSRARAEGRRHVLMEAKVPTLTDDPTMRFAAARGFHAVETEVVRHLSLPVSDSLLTELGAASRSPDYRVETYVDRVPDHLLPGVGELMSLLAVDAPSGDLAFEAESWTPERLARMYDREHAQGRRRVSAVALDRAGTVVAQSDLIAHSDPALRVIQEGTYVHRSHRGHRLGMAVKVANLQRLQAELPGRPRVVTMNAETNDHMVAINVALGFQIVELAPQLVCDLPD